jgi:predicted ATP-dependent endonuclease of OLD family
VRVNSNTGLWEIYFEDGENGYIPLSKMGSGIKTVLLVLLNLLILPTIEGNTEDQYVFAFEELENNLHPALLRRLFLYIIKYCEQYNSYFFITTHSNIVIDIFGNYENSQIIHVTKDDDGTAICSTVKTHFQNKNILCDLDIRASDLLQSNGIIWVEGPSDRIYINKWLQSITSFYKEGVHYSFVFYGGKSIANMSFDSEWVERELIPLLKINHNAFVIMDRDGKDNAVELNSTKRRIIAEIGEENCWVTEGREIENYLSNRTLSEWLKEKHGIETKVQNDKDTKLENTISPLAPLVKYETAKKQFSIEISEFISLEDVATLDLASNMTKLMKRINDWNSLNTKA